MSVSKIRKIVLFGAGNVASNLAYELAAKGFKLVQIYNRSESPGRSLAIKTGADYCDDLRKISLQADLYIFAISDIALPSLAGSIDLGNKTAIMVSGTLDIGILKGTSSRYGVVYPVQTFSRNHPKHFRGIPLCVEGNDPETEKMLMQFAGELSELVYAADLDRRRQIHLAAVIANNFPTYLFSAAEEILEEKGISYDILFPLIRQTSRNACRHEVSMYLTGPAARGDRNVIEKHLEMLNGHPEIRELYRQITENIINRKKLNDKL